MIQSRTAVHRRESVAIGYRTSAAPERAPVPADDIDIAAAAIQVRRLRYFRDLLLSGFESTIWPDRSARTLRSERLALGIDLPELDAVAIWSVRCGDGTLAIPFVDYILARAREAAAGFVARDTRGTLREPMERLDAALATVAPAAPAPASALPRLEEVHVPQEAIAGLCGSGGILDRLVDTCERMTLEALRDTPPVAS